MLDSKMKGVRSSGVETLVAERGLTSAVPSDKIKNGNTSCNSDTSMQELY